MYILGHLVVTERQQASLKSDVLDITVDVSDSGLHSWYY
jgi:hypothetical protein